MKTPSEVATEWYDEEGIHNAIMDSGSSNLGAWPKIPTDVYSAEFSRWLTHQYRLAFAKGFQIGMGEHDD